MTHETETRLRSALAASATRAGSPSPTLAADVLATARAPRPATRPLMLVAAAAAVVAAVVIGATTLLGGTGDRSPAALPTEPTSTATPTYSAGFTPYPFAPRGSLTGDTGLVEDLRLRSWGTPGGYYGPAPETRQVVFAGAVDGGGVQVFVIGRDGDRWIGTWFAGPDVGSLQGTGDPGPFDPSTPLVWVNVVGGIGALVVIGEPGDQMTWSTAEVTADGSTVTNTFELPVTDGIGSLPVTEFPGQGTQVRVTRDGVVVHDGGADGGSASGSSPGPSDDELVAAALIGARGTPSSDLVRTTLQTVAGGRGVSPADLTASVVWGGPVTDGDAALLVIPFPSGAREVPVAAGWVAETPASGGDALSSSGPCGTQVIPADRDLTTAVLAAVCTHSSISDGSPIGSELVVVGPVGTVGLRFLDAAGGQVGSATADGTGAWVGPVPAGIADVQALAADGTVLAADPVLPGA